jgi:hypothetical protein
MQKASYYPLVCGPRSKGKIRDTQNKYVSFTFDMLSFTGIAGSLEPNLHPVCTCEWQCIKQFSYRLENKI